MANPFLETSRNFQNRSNIFNKMKIQIFEK